MWCIVTSFGVIDAATTTSYLPPPPGRHEAVEQHHLHPAILAPLFLSVVALVAALGAIVIGAVGLIRRRGARWWVLLLPVVAIIAATLGPLSASLIRLPAY